jgi:hypothetical protein
MYRSRQPREILPRNSEGSAGLNPGSYEFWLDPDVHDAKTLEPLLVP